MKRNRFHSSASRFSMGVPVQIMRKPPVRLIAADDRFVAAFLIIWASSRTIVAKLHILEDLRLLLEQRVRADHQVERAEGLEDLVAPAEVADAEADRPQRRGEPLGLGDPVGTDAGRRRHEGRPLGRPMQNQGQGLHGLAQPHVVGQAGPYAPFGQPGQPDEAVHLVRTQGRLKRRGDRRLVGLDLAQPLDVGVEGRIRLELADLVLPLLQTDGGQRVHPQGVALADGLVPADEPLQLLAKLAAQGDVLVLAQGDERAVARSPSGPGGSAF